MRYPLKSTKMARLMQRITLAIFSMLAFTPALADERVTAGSELDRIAYAVDGAESSHAKDLSMWRPDPAGPQGPMQLSEKAAMDVGGGDRFDIAQNRAIGRAYLALLYRRYGNWADAISAYNWGLGKFDKWISAGRPTKNVASGVTSYLRRVLRDSGLCNGAGAASDCSGQPSISPSGWASDRSAGAVKSNQLARSLAKAELLAVKFGAEESSSARRLRPDVR